MKEKVSLLISSNKKQEEPINRGNFESVLSQQKNIEENYARSDSKEGKKKKQYKNNLDFLKRYLLFQLRWNDTLNQRLMNNIKVYCLLLRLIEPRKITISSIQKREFSLDLMPIDNNLSISELIKKGILIIEPTRLFRKNDGQWINNTELVCTYEFIFASIYDEIFDDDSNYKQHNKSQVDSFVVPMWNYNFTLHLLFGLIYYFSNAFI